MLFKTTQKKQTLCRQAEEKISIRADDGIRNK
jgi:hypothetical protein